MFASLVLLLNKFDRKISETFISLHNTGGHFMSSTLITR